MWLSVLLRYIFIILQLVLNRILLFQASFLILGPVVITVHYRTLLPYFNLFCVLLFIILGCSSSSLYRQLFQECDAVSSVNMNQRRKCYTFRCFCFISWSSDCLPLIMILHVSIVISFSLLWILCSRLRWVIFGK